MAARSLPVSGSRSSRPFQPPAKNLQYCVFLNAVLEYNCLFGFTISDIFLFLMLFFTFLRCYFTVLFVT